ncbi:unnamed protein product [Paramecium octaurelia]|uniref:Uncharacterized protein n=1 Tax=Paramecium octaurelia TaxID=43137 RepID=A0A8S1XZC9_PAROT|nr:unnamed protein product [Paramecium octaurelia]
MEIYNFIHYNIYYNDFVYYLLKETHHFFNYGKTQEIRQQLYWEIFKFSRILSFFFSQKDPKTDPIMMLQAVGFGKDFMEMFNGSLPHFLSMTLLKIKEQHTIKANFTLAKNLIYTQQIFGNTLSYSFLECIIKSNAVFVQNLYDIKSVDSPS